jgi:hypothetical protein
MGSAGLGLVFSFGCGHALDWGWISTDKATSDATESSSSLIISDGGVGTKAGPGPVKTGWVPAWSSLRSTIRSIYGGGLVCRVSVWSIFRACGS